MQFSEELMGNLGGVYLPAVGASRLLFEHHLGESHVRLFGLSLGWSNIVDQFGGIHGLFSEIRDDLLVGDAVHLVEGGQSAL